MPLYRAKEPGFFGGVYYAPGSKRELIEVDKPFDKTPSWMEPYIESKPVVTPQIDFLNEHLSAKKAIDGGNHIEVL